MKYLILILALTLGSISTSAQADVYDPNKEYNEATSIDEVVYDPHGIPVNCTPRQYKKWRREIEREKRKFYGTRFIDRVGDTMSATFRGAGRVLVYIGTGVVITLIVNSALKTAQKNS